MIEYSWPHKFLQLDPLPPAGEELAHESEELRVKHARALLQNRVQRAFARKKLTLKAGFERLDADGSGSVDVEELVEGLQDIDPSISEEGIRDLMGSVDADGSGGHRPARRTLPSCTPSILGTTF